MSARVAFPELVPSIRRSRLGTLDVFDVCKSTVCRVGPRDPDSDDRSHCAPTFRPNKLMIRTPSYSLFVFYNFCFNNDKLDLNK